MAPFNLLVLICLIGLAILGVLIRMVILKRRDQKNSKEIISLEVAVCIQKANGDIIIRQRRGKSLLGLLVGLLLVFGSLAMIVKQASDSPSFLLETLEVTLLGVSLLVLGGLVAWVSGRGFREPHVTINTASQMVQFRHGLLRKKQTWSFDDIHAVVKQSGAKNNWLFFTVETLVSSDHMGRDMNRTFIGLQHVDDRVIQIGTATRQAANRVPDLIAEALGKPIVNME